MVNKKSIIELYESMGLEWTEDMFVLEPDNTYSILEEYERSYPYRTEEIVRMDTCPENMDKEVFEEWKTKWYEYLAYQDTDKKNIKSK